MAAKDAIRWAREEWGIFAQSDRMSPRQKLRWLGQWVPFGVRTIGYGTLSVGAGPLTPDRAASLWAMRQWSRSSLCGLGIAVEATGTERVPTGGLVYASNHLSLLDILVLGSVLPGDFKWAAKRSLMSIPFLGWHLRLSGHIPVDRREGRRSSAAVIDGFVRVLEQDKPVLIFPEGTRSLDGTVQPFKKGGFYAAIRAHKPVVPVALAGTHDLMHKGAADTGQVRGNGHLRVVRVRAGEPIYPTSSGTESDRVGELRDRTREAIVAMYRELQNGGSAH